PPPTMLSAPGALERPCDAPRVVEAGRAVAVLRAVADGQHAVLDLEDALDRLALARAARVRLVDPGRLLARVDLDRGRLQRGPLRLPDDLVLGDLDREQVLGALERPLAARP